MPYSRFKRDELILRDLLAHERTVLANERTLLAYIRTAIGLMAAGGTVLALFSASAAMWILGVGLLVLGVLVGGFGGWRFAVVAGRMRQLGAGGGDEPDRIDSRSPESAEGRSAEGSGDL